MMVVYRYPEQLARVQRWYQRFKDISDGKLHYISSDFYLDDMYAYFMNCYHLKEWIKNDTNQSPVSTKVDAFIKSDPNMALCGDICNSIKHLVLKKPKKSNWIEFGKRIFMIDVGTRPATIAVKYSIYTESGPIDAFELATLCLHAWEDFLK